MRVLVTGAAGFIGRQLINELLKRKTLRDATGQPRQISELILADMAPLREIETPTGNSIRIRPESGDFGDPDYPQRLVGEGVDSVFHLAATLTMETETKFDRGLAVNVQGLIRLLEACRALQQGPRFVFASSIAAFGGLLPQDVDDSVAPAPETSYGTHKVITELLINDYSRHGFIDGRALRLPVVLVRPSEATTPTVSDRIAAIVREPLLGHDVVCPLAAHTLIPVASVQRVAKAFVDLHDLPCESFGHDRAVNLPSLTVSIGDMVAELQRFSGRLTLGHVAWEPDDKLQAVMESWPSRLSSQRASSAGIRSDENFGEIVDAFVKDFLPTRLDESR